MQLITLLFNWRKYSCIKSHRIRILYLYDKYFFILFDVRGERKPRAVFVIWKKTSAVREIMAKIISESHVAEVGRDFWWSSGPTSYSSRTTVTYSWFPRIMSRWPFQYHLMDRDSISPLGNLHQCSVPLQQKCFLVFQRNLLCFILCPVSVGTTEKSLALSLLCPSFNYSYSSWDSPWAFSRLNSPISLSLFS